MAIGLDKIGRTDWRTSSTVSTVRKEERQSTVGAVRLRQVKATRGECGGHWLMLAQLTLTRIRLTILRLFKDKVETVLASCLPLRHHCTMFRTVQIYADCSRIQRCDQRGSWAYQLCYEPLNKTCQSDPALHSWWKTCVNCCHHSYNDCSANPTQLNVQESHCSTAAK